MTTERTLKKQNHQTVCSIFVNPTQFNDAEDLEKYPCTPSKDIIALEKVGCEVVFLPTVAQVYPPGLDTQLGIDIEGLDIPMEGSKRPGHFDGVIQVVNRLLNLVEPDFLYMGQKDYQQFLICKKMIAVLDKPVQIKPVPIKRAKDGLALSSRNVRLTAENRIKAPLIYQTLMTAKEKLAAGESVASIEKWAMQQLSIPGFRPEYFSIVDADTLSAVKKIANHKTIIACTAVWAGNIRLIDNMFLRKF